ncbi:oxidoreductase bli-4 [Biscogniauxia mediterranea]|nr:oxidoreductase bli-4 [Biscogniauxia mediterranea]
MLSGTKSNIKRVRMRTSSYRLGCITNSFCHKCSISTYRPFPVRYHKTVSSPRSFSISLPNHQLPRPSEVMNTIKNTLGENLGGKAQSLSTHQFSLDDVPDLSGKVAVVTGGSEGIGYGCTYTLLQHGIAQVYVLSLSADVARGARDALAAALGPDAAARTRWIQCDLADWPRVKAAADEIKRGAERLDILINNAGRGAMAFELTDYGVDRHMAVNHMGHVVLTSHLLPLLRRTASRHATTARIALQASNAHAAAPGDVRFASAAELSRDLGPSAQYGRSKLAAILWARYFARHSDSGNGGVLMNATHPGFVSTRMSREDIYDAYPRAGHAVAVGLEPLKKTAFQGAAPIMYAATCATGSGLYICPPAVPEEGSALACDGALGDRLMELTRRVVREKTRRESADRGCPFDDLVLY